jgi:hypothetical protein
MDPVFDQNFSERSNRTLAGAVVGKSGPHIRQKAAAQWLGAAHNDKAVNSQHLAFMSRHCDIYS